MKVKKTEYQSAFSLETVKIGHHSRGLQELRNEGEENGVPVCVFAGDSQNRAPQQRVKRGTKAVLESQGKSVDPSVEIEGLGRG
jgi:hypothetical protein